MAHPLYVLSKKILMANEHSCYQDHLDTLSVQCKVKESLYLETRCGTWNRLMLGCHPGQFSFILHAASDTLPMAMNLRRWHIQCNAKCSLCNCTRPTTAHILSGCPVALSHLLFDMIRCYIVWLQESQPLLLSLMLFMSMQIYQACMLMNLHLVLSLLY